LQRESAASGGHDAAGVVDLDRRLILLGFMSDEYLATDVVVDGLGMVPAGRRCSC
jgi:hypothetical protein